VARYWSVVLAAVLCLFGLTAVAAPPAEPAKEPAKTSEEAAAAPAEQPAASAKQPATPAKQPATPAKQPAPAASKQPPAGQEPGAAAPAKAGVDVSRRKSEIYGERLDALQSDVDSLKDRIFRSKARLSVLKETVLRGVLAGSRVQLAHRNRMGSQYKLVKIVVILDGAQIFAKSDESGALNSEDEIIIYDANLVPGPHNLTIELEYRGQGYGVFSYLNGYSFDARASHSFTAPENGSIKILSVGYEKGNFTTEMDDRPAVDWQQVGLDASGRPLPRQRGRGNDRATTGRGKSKTQAGGAAGARTGR